MQSLESSLFVVDESAAAVSGIKSGGLHAAYPREKPSRAELIKWLEGGREYLGTIQGSSVNVNTGLAQTGGAQGLTVGSKEVLTQTNTSPKVVLIWC